MSETALQKISNSDREIVRRLARGEHADALSVEMGFSPSYIVERLLSSEELMHALYMEQRALVRSYAGAAIEIIRELALTPAKSETGKKIQLEAAKTLAAYNGFGGNAGGSVPKSGEKSASEMSLEEIEAALEAAKRKASDNAKVIDQAPAIAQDSAQDDSEAIDILT